MLTVCERIAEDRQPDRDVPYAPNCGCMDAALEITGGALAGFSKHRWPADGPERELLEYLDELHREQGQPSMARIAKAVGLVAGTVSAFFTGARPIGPERLAAVIEYLAGDGQYAEKLRRAAATVRNDRRAGRPAAVASAVPHPDLGWTAAVDAGGTTRLDVI